MAMADIQVLLSYYSMTEDLNPNPTTELEKIVNDLRIKYRTYVVDLDVEYGMVVLPTLFVHDFGDELGRYATLVDRYYNEFEVLVERNNGRIYLTTGWHALKDFFNVRLGSWVSMVYVGRGKFGIYLKDRFGGRISTPRFNPPMKFELERQMLPFHEFDVLPSPFAHDNFNFEFSYEKRLTADDYESLSNFSVSSFLYLSALQGQ